MSTCVGHEACPKCGSRDNLARYDDGHAHCFGCEYYEFADGEERVTQMDPDKAPLLVGLEYIALTKRGITQETCQRYGYGIAHGYQVAPYYDASGRAVAQKVRDSKKQFSVRGDLSQARLFGSRLVRESGRRIIVTEGEIDAMSVHQALGGSWPVVSVPNGAAGAHKAIQKDLELLENYETVVLCFDQDEVGEAATARCVELFSPGKVAVADLGTFKDANDMLRDAGPSALRSAVWDARVWRPDGVVNMKELYERVKAPLEMGIPYPWASLNEKLFGSRPGEIVVWCAGTGAGKTSALSEIVYALIRGGTPTGIVYLEEGVERAGKRLVGIDLNKPLHLPGVEVTDAEFSSAWGRTLGTGLLHAYEHFGSLDADILLSRIRYMAKSLGVKVIILDHISIVVSGADLAQDERRTLDKIMTRLKSIAVENNITIHVVTHLRRPPGGGTHEEGRKVSLSDLRGSQALAQLADAVIALERDQQEEDEDKRNTASLRVLKNRYAGLTGPAGELMYNHDTGRLLDVWGDEEGSDGPDY